MTIIKQIKSDKYYLLLCTQLLFFAIVPFLEEQSVASHILIPILLALILITGISAISTKPLIANFGIAVAIFFPISISFLEFEKTPFAVLAAFMLFMVYFIFVIYRIITILLITKEIKISLLAGAFSGYLMIGVILTFFLIMLNTFDPHTLNIPESTMGFGDFLYFSLITMTTIGYGDISPVNPVAQMVSAFSAIISQFYLAVVVAVIVGKIINAERAKK
jgi:voltage-gated potassium channel